MKALFAGFTRRGSRTGAAAADDELSYHEAAASASGSGSGMGITDASGGVGAMPQSTATVSGTDGTLKGRGMRARGRLDNLTDSIAGKRSPGSPRSRSGPPPSSYCEPRTLRRGSRDMSRDTAAGSSSSAAGDFGHVGTSNGNGMAASNAGSTSHALQSSPQYARAPTPDPGSIQHVQGSGLMRPPNTSSGASVTTNGIDTRSGSSLRRPASSRSNEKRISTIGGRFRSVRGGLPMQASYSEPCSSQSAAAPSAEAGSSSDTTVKTLAQRLNELAVANGDGLLNNEEYRILRQNIFERLAQGETELPQESPIGRIPGDTPLVDASAASSTDASVPVEEDDPGRRTAHSVRSNRSGVSNVTSLFRRSAARKLANGADDSEQGPHASTTSHWSSNDSLHPSSMHSGAARSSKPSLQRLRSTGSNKLKRAADLERTFSSARSARSVTTAATGGAASNDSGGSANGLFGASYTDKPSVEIRAEIAVVEAEGRRLLDAFSGLEQTAIGKYRLSYDQIRRVYAEFGLRASTGSLDVPDCSRTASSDSFDLGRSGSSNRLSFTLGRKRASSMRSSEADGPGTNRNRAFLSPPSSYRGPIDRPVSAHVPSPSDMDLDSDDGSEMLRLRAELEDITERRAAVVKRYEERVAFLRSKLRSATIREGLVR